MRASRTCAGSPEKSAFPAARSSFALDRAPRSPDADERAREAPPLVHEALRAPGQPLDAPTRSSFEHRFGGDLGRVRVHADSLAGQSAQAVAARAYTVGRHIV